MPPAFGSGSISEQNMFLLFNRIVSDNTTTNANYFYFRDLLEFVKRNFAKGLHKLRGGTI